MYIKSINNVIGYKGLPDGFNIEFDENIHGGKLEWQS